MNPETKNSRREFVKNSAIIAGGTMAMPLFSRANYFSGADDAIKIALVGCGGRGTGAITQALSTKQNVKLVAMADAFRDILVDRLSDDAANVVCLEDGLGYLAHEMATSSLLIDQFSAMQP